MSKFREYLQTEVSDSYKSRVLNRVQNELLHNAQADRRPIWYRLEWLAYGTAALVALWSGQKLIQQNPPHDTWLEFVDIDDINDLEVISQISDEDFELLIESDGDV